MSKVQHNIYIYKITSNSKCAERAVILSKPRHFCFCNLATRYSNQPNHE